MNASCGRTAFIVGAMLAPHAFGAGELTTIDFETYPDGTDVVPGVYLSDQFLSQGVVFEPYWSGRANATRILEEGDFGAQNFGNSPITLVDVGDYGEHTLIRFVDPFSRAQRGVDHVAVRVGDGDASSETFSFFVYDTAGLLLYSETITPSPSTAGYSFSYSSALRNVGSLVIELDLGSASGAGFDDLVFTPANLCLDADPNVAPPGTALTITTSRGTPGNLVGLAAVEINGAPLVPYVWLAFATFDANGEFVLGGQVPPGVSGITVAFRSYAIGPSGRLIDSNDESVAF